MGAVVPGPIATIVPVLTLGFRQSSHYQYFAIMIGKQTVIWQARRALSMAKGLRKT